MDPTSALAVFGLISKVMTEAPVLMPDAIKLLTDLMQCGQDFQKLLNDYNQIKSTPVPGVNAAG
jgi:hypothetical protein